jgi:hypothetical protein
MLYNYNHPCERGRSRRQEPDSSQDYKTTLKYEVQVREEKRTKGNDHFSAVELLTNVENGKKVQSTYNEYKRDLFIKYRIFIYNLSHFLSINCR